MDIENSKIELAKTEHEILMEDPKTARKRRRADKRRRRKYKFSDKHHSKAAIVASVMAIPAIALFVFALVMATSEKGQSGALAGWMPFCSLILATAGIIISALTFRKADTIYTFSWIGLISNSVIWLFVAFVLVIGL